MQKKEEEAGQQPEGISSKSIVYTSDAGDRHETKIVEIVKKVLSDRRITTCSKVAVKPNLMDPTHSPGVTVSPSVLEAVVSNFRDYYEEVLIVEGGGYSFPAEKMFAGHDVHGICRRTGASVADVCSLKRTEVGVTSRWNKQVKFPFPEILLDKEWRIVSLACLKTHCFTGVSLSIKNLWGCIPDRKRTLLHPYINEILAEIAFRIPNPVAVIDGKIALDGRGPKMGEPFVGNIILGSDDLLAADITATRLMGIDPESIAHLRSGAIRKWGAWREPQTAIQTMRTQTVGRTMKPKRNWFDTIAIMIYWSPMVTNLVYNSKLTTLIESIVRKSGLSPGADTW